MSNMPAWNQSPPPAWPQVGQVPMQGALLDPFSGQPDPNGNSGLVWAQTPLGPRPWLPYSVNNTVGFFIRIYVVTLDGTDPAGTEVIRPIQVSSPGHVYAITGAARRTDGVALATGQSSLDQFLLRMDHSQGDKLITSPALGSAVVGTAQFPAYVDLNGWKFLNGATIMFGITPLVTNLRVDVTVKFLEIKAGVNYGAL